MKNFGVFLANLRSSANLSLESLALLVGSSKSTLSRLENDDVPQPFRGGMRKLVIGLGEILCTSQKETERYLQLASLDMSLLAETERLQLGYTPHVTKGATDELAQLQHLEQVYHDLLTQQEEREVVFGITETPQLLKRKIQEYANTLAEIQHRLSVLTGQEDSTSPTSEALRAAQVHHVVTSEGRLVVGQQHGEDFFTTLGAQSIHELASPHAQWLMRLADIECFAVDDCIILTNSRNFRGWEPHEIETTLFNTPLPIPNDLETLRQKKIAAIEKDYMNSTHYRLLSFTPSFSDTDLLRVTLAPICFFDYYSLTPFFDEPVLTTIDGSQATIRQKYGNTALTYISTERGMSLIPAPISVQCIAVTSDGQILLMRRSSLVAFYPNHWSASFEETMNAPGGDPNCDPESAYDTTFFDAAIRGLDEEFAIPASAVENVKVLSLNVEYLTLSVDVIAVIRLNIAAEDIHRRWVLQARDKNEATKLNTLPNKLGVVVNKLFTRTLWHPTSRMRLIQYLFHEYGVDEVQQAITKQSSYE